MSMQDLIECVEILQSEEYERASKKFGPVHASEHEAFAVLLEELEEASAEIQEAANCLDILWRAVKCKTANTEDKLALLKSIGYRATLASCESIQVGAMAHKFIQTIQEGEN